MIRRSLIVTFSLLALIIGSTSILIAQTVKKPAKKAVLVEIQGAISPASGDFIIRGINKASHQNAHLFILQMDTPGGLAKSMRAIIKRMLASSVPVVVFVGPSGARAASAGTFIVYASNVAVMAPGTHLGAASPVSIGGGGVSPPGSKDKNKQKKTAKAQSTMSKKIFSDTTAYIRSLAQLRGRNVEWAEKAVKEAASLTATEALKKNVIDLIANDVQDLLKKINGRTVEIQGRKIILDTDGIIVEKEIPDWRFKLLATITDPSVAYILLLLGIYGLFFEFASPGFVLPGVVGAICLVLALYALHLLPISYAGLGLIIIGIMFIIAEAFVPSFGALGIGGVIAFVAGSILLFDTALPAYRVALPVVAAMAVTNFGFFVLLMAMAIKSHRRQTVVGTETLVGEIAEVFEDTADKGQVKIGGEFWQMQTNTPVKRGQKVKVVEVKGLLLIVKPI